MFSPIQCFLCRNDIVIVMNRPMSGDRWGCYPYIHGSGALMTIANRDIIDARRRGALERALLSLIWPSAFLRHRIQHHSCAIIIQPKKVKRVRLTQELQDAIASIGRVVTRIAQERGTGPLLDQISTNHAGGTLEPVQLG